MQKTDFKFKVVVHDDASTDGTRAVIEEYVNRYPDLFIPVYQTENQYSKGVKIYATYIKPLIRCKYVAICEGDDYWTDANKLQCQYDYMEQHEDCSMCTHNTRFINIDGEPQEKYMNASPIDTDYSTEDIIKANGGGLFHTSSYFAREKIFNSKPEAFNTSGIGDYAIAIYMSLCGYVHYIGKVMSHYRVGDPSSWSQRTYSSIDSVLKHDCNMIEGLKRINEFTEKKYDAAFQEVINQYRYDILKLQNNGFKIITDPEMKEIFRQNSIKERAKIMIKTILKKLGYRTGRGK